MIAFLKRLFLNLEGELSLTKIGATIVLFAGTAVTLQMAEIIAMSKGLFAACIVVAIAGGKLTIDGLRDALGKK